MNDLLQNGSVQASSFEFLKKDNDFVVSTIDLTHNNVSLEVSSDEEPPLVVKRPHRSIRYVISSDEE
jgi:hypothetical protein